MSEMSRFFALLVAIVLIPLTGAFAASDTLRLTLDECLNLARRQGQQAQIMGADSLSALGRWRVSRGGSLPQLRLGGTLPGISEGTNYDIVTDSTGRETYENFGYGDRTWTGSIELSQETPWGATATLSTRMYRNLWFNDRIADLGEIVEYSLRRRVELRQPILGGNPAARRRKIGTLGWQSDLIQIEQARRELTWSVTQSFFDLVSATGALEISRQDLEQGRTAEELARRKIQAGLIPEVELLQIQVDLARRESSFRRTQASLEASRDRLRIELGLPFDQPLEAVWQPEGDVTPAQIDTSGDLLDVRQSRLELESRELTARANLWSARLNASLTGFYETDTRKPEFDALDEAGDINRGFSFNLELPLLGFGTTSGRVQEIRADLRRARANLILSEARNAAELRSALRAVEQANDRIQIANAALELSQRSQEITVGRYDSGLVDARELLDSQLDLTRARTEALNARIDYELAVANLRRLAP